MNANSLIDSLECFPDVVGALVKPLPDSDARWKPPDGAWSILEIIAHLADEEVEDFRRRVEMTLNNPHQPWPPIDPEGWAAERRYDRRDPAEELKRFASEREASVRWLRTLKDPDWARAYEHPKLGPLRAGDVFVSWVAHDALHLRQIAKRRFQIAQRDGGGFRTDYAGQWSV
ncbi:MAG: DinB family protein [Phycisphaerales bacterium]|nr:MAG: DinB family protein [Phycisphaerales bacterium]